MNKQSLLLVISQLMLIGLLASPISKLMPYNFTTALGFVLLVAGFAIGIWAANSLTWRNFTVVPEPVQEGTLVSHGPYQYIRHPMYTALIVMGLGAAIAHGGMLKVLYLILLIVVLYFKIKREEHLLNSTYSAYTSYMERTDALLPRIF